MDHNLGALLKNGKYILTIRFIITAYMKIFSLPTLLFVFTTLSAAPLSARTVEYRLGSKAGIEFTVPYGAFGLFSHKGKAELDRASLLIDSENLSSTTGEFSVNLAGMTMEHKEKNCHMRESLGLNYAASDFPDKHVCDDNFELPQTGKNAIVYPEIIFRILAIKNISQTDNEATFEVEGQWTIHGVTRKQLLPIKLSPDKDKMRISTTAKFNLKDFGLKIRPVKFFFFPVHVVDPITVDINLLMDSYPAL